MSDDYFKRREVEKEIDERKEVDPSVNIDDLTKKMPKKRFQLKLNLSRKQYIIALVYSLAFPVIAFIDMLLSVNLYPSNLFSESIRILLALSAIATFPFLILGFLFGLVISKILGSIFMPIGVFIMVFIQVILIIHIRNKRKQKQDGYFKSRDNG